MAQVSNKELRKQQLRSEQLMKQEALDVAKSRSQSLDSRLLYVVMGLCVFGIGIASYLTYIHYSHAPIICATGGGCEAVNSSKYATFVGIPVALMGLAAYIVLLGLAFVRLRLNRLSQTNNRYTLDVAIFLLSLGGVAFSGYLTAMEAFVILNWCMWCIFSAITLTTLLCINGYRVWLNHFSSSAEF